MRLLLSTIRSGCPESGLALKNLYNVVAEAPIDTTIREYRMGDTDRSIYEELMKERYDLLYFHCDLYNEKKINHIAEWMKKAVPSTVIIIGGMPVTVDTKAYMARNPEVDYVIRGEEEGVFFRFIHTILTYRFEFAGLDGLAYRDGENIVVNPIGEPMRYEDMPFAYEHFSVEEGSTVYYESSRGNPDRCHYHQLLPDRKIRSLSLARVCSELRYFIIKKPEKVVFVDKWFNYGKERAYRIWEYLINNDNGVTTFCFDINGDLLDEETILLLGHARKGLFEFTVDIESTNAEPLDAAGRKANIYQLMYNISKVIQNRNIHVTVKQRAGLPCETPELFARAFNKIYGLHADCFDIEVLHMVKGCVLRSEAANYGYRFDSEVPYEVIANDFMPADRLIDIVRLSKVLELYQGYFADSLNRILGDTGRKAYDFFMGLTDFISERGLMHLLSLEEERYRVLYAYAAGIYDERGENLKLQILMEVMTHELEKHFGTEAVKRLERKGWDLNVK